MNSTAISEGRKLLSVKERMRFESYMAEIFSRLGMDLNSESCRRTPQRWVQALVDMTEGYNGDPNIEVVFEREWLEVNLKQMQVEHAPPNILPYLRGPECPAPSLRQACHNGKLTGAQIARMSGL